jgi:signal transduction histidine kinase
MNMPLMKAEPATVTPATTAKVVPLPPKRPALATRTRMVLGNFLSNADKYSPPGADIDVILRCLGSRCRSVRG